MPDFVPPEAVTLPLISDIVPLISDMTASNGVFWGDLLAKCVVFIPHGSAVCEG